MSTSNPQLAAGEYLELRAGRGLTSAALSNIGYTLPSESTRYWHTHTITELDAALARPPSDADGPGHVYLMKTTDSNGGIESKVGFSNDPDRRLGEWGRQCYRSEFELVTTIPTLHARKLERVVHKFLKIADLWKEPYCCDSCFVHHREKFELDEFGGIPAAESITKILRDLVDA
ncbi:meiotically up-regulated gene 113-domain-containing protein [Favolaschia claudopus]|uniref:Meiotically up-regulated gene 113-domain-containing protein n=1 Tax=Favolaschia claudopus TaxID=2862362 RepID=A0AAW0ADL2_9AGAR